MIVNCQCEIINKISMSLFLKKLVYIIVECNFLKLIFETFISHSHCCLLYIFWTTFKTLEPILLNWKVLFYFFLDFLSLNIQESQDCKGRGRPILTPFHRLVSLHEHLDFLRAITAESLPQYIVTGPESGRFGFRA